MFGWFKPKSSLSQAQKDWIDQRFTWLLEQFGEERLAQDAILPTDQFFPDLYRATREDADKLFGRVCKLIGIDRSRVDLRFFCQGYSSIQGEIGKSSFGPSGSPNLTLGAYEHSDGLTRIWIEESRLKETESLVATMAHELGHVLLLGDGRCDGSLIDHEPLTDLLAVFIGFGVFSANSALREVNWQHLNTSGWSMSRQGYLTTEELAYALAVYADIRGDAGAAWKKHLRSDVASLVNVELQQLKSRDCSSGANGRTRLEHRALTAEQPVLANAMRLNHKQEFDFKGAQADDPGSVATNLEPADGHADVDAFTLGVGHYIHGDYEQAVELLTEAIELDQNDLEAWLYRARVMSNQGNYEAAIDDFTMAINLGPEDSAAFTERALAYLNLKCYQKSIVDCRVVSPPCVAEPIPA